ncbi:MAG: sigma-70 family RNA polymerase sigma factor [Chelatococcus sp.]|uniref:sigma-70 family RNA polymerase sigma factor n=1 Tax=unclassified Chelatococcus TaxID=2638111 RepID=UPI001BCF5CA4|nr:MULTISPECIES: sigma-70 family RNA polymerase sigma factor [unclassified Chelatococcus]CAH1649866.1 RNA polymerase sigma-70 factor (ECF subfamily) [Hyphomicrobiales bacterium]MBS7739659.1 sigma-70 family RNA polymerase sigma factor [Chelatococcus sp. HY11]MBX3539664.1 sigma-70 family RNA polymerase sigma factor [Chelatococcus sp.]MBX3544028.1 sigma-70 family RNA polymerase sigma factor [Chelatococcus sp.]MCO5075804.1 sigma-70 family RNA polymerase sigma factor [Chelatococcus sp.]
MLRIWGMTRDTNRMNVLSLLPALRRYARALTRDAASAEDLVHDTLVKAYEKKGSFRPGRNLRTWLFSILHNHFVDGLRKTRADTLRIAGAAETAETVVPPVQEHSVRLAQVRQAFMALPDEQRMALHLVAIEGMSYQEAAMTLGIPVGTLMSRLGRARATLRGFEEGEQSADKAIPSEGKSRGAPATPGRTDHLRVVGGTDDSTH